MAYGNLLCVARHPVDIHDGRVLGYGEYVASVDLDDPHNKVLIDEGHVLVVAGPPVPAPRTASGEPNPTPAPKTSTDGGKQ